MQIQITHASQFRDQFRQAGRENQFSFEALNMLYEYFEDTDPEMKLDVDKLCCDYAESPIDELKEAYAIKGDVIEYINRESVVLGVTSTGNVVYAQF
jgi:hypothetical protein